MSQPIGRYSTFCGAALPCRPVLCLSCIQHIKISTLPGVCTYVRHAAFGLFSWMERGALGIAEIACLHIIIVGCLDRLFRSVFVPRERA